MCGISASKPSDSVFMSYAIRAQEMRGPDETHLLDLGFASVGINRLSISGLVKGSQPLSSKDGTIAVIFNGAIYNVDQICSDFGFVLESSNDGEVIASLYQRFGLSFANYLEGMFAICIIDKLNQLMVVAVDPIGIKPLYLYLGLDEVICVASDISSFPESIRNKAVRVPPGTVWCSDGRRQRVARAYCSQGGLLELLRESVYQQIPKEVGWGCMLSGGLDSSLIVQLASERVSNLTTLTCGMRDGTDMVAGRTMATHVGSSHHEILVDTEELPLLVDEVIRATCSMEPWTIMGGVGTYLVAREAKRLGLKVLLSGEGADELFAGYDEFQNIPDIFLDSILMQYQADLGVSECLRLDRCSMAHSIESRVPFLCTSVIRRSRMILPSEKIKKSGLLSICKYALRQAAAEVLPREFSDRSKEEFSHGSGISSQLNLIARRMYPNEKIAQIAQKHPSFCITTPSEAWFLDRWLSIFGDSIGLDWKELARRGLVRQPVSFYIPRISDPAIYL